MNMKGVMKLSGIGLLLLVLGFCLADAAMAAPSMPYTVVGTLEGDNIDGVTIIVEDLSPVCYGVTRSIITNDQGQFSIVINNFCERVWTGDTIRATISGSSKEVILQEGLTYISFAEDEDIYKSAGGKSYSKDEPTTTTIPETTTTTLKPIVTTTTIKQDTTTTTLPGDEPDELSVVWISLIGLAIVILGGFAWGKGFAGLARYYMRKADEAETKKERVAYQQRAIKMLKTALKKAAAGEYEKDSKGG